ncbi:hypothetical protein POTOM_002611 [Populus tomentosa]|uniref:Uncharacterized protein n=1 Tax=Populus tomentosa TaxID=118781 RepID=A0A8X8DK26_POPTO|nr:hypothetical protein POTOM_002611 [Populus tomentosa]
MLGKNKAVELCWFGLKRETENKAAEPCWFGHLKRETEEIRGAKKFRHVGIESSLKNKSDQMYSNIVTTAAFAWALSSRVLVCSDIDPGTSNAGINRDGLEERSGDSEEDVIPDFQTDITQMVGGINMSSSNNTKSGGKKKERDPYEVRGKKKKTSGIGVQLLSR